MESAVYMIGDTGGPTEEALFQELLGVRKYGLSTANLERRFRGLRWVARRISEGADDLEKIENLLRRAAESLGDATTAAAIEALLGLTDTTRGLDVPDRHAEAAEIYDDTITVASFRIHKENPLLSKVASRCFVLIAEARLAMHLPVSEWPPVLIENGWGADLPMRNQKLVQRKPQRGRQRGDHPRLFDD